MLNDKLHSFNIYRNGNTLTGIADEIELPGIEFISDTITGYGIAGEIDDPTMGLTKSLEWELKFKTLYEDVAIDPTKVDTYTIRGSQQGRDATGNIGYAGIKGVLQGRPKSLMPGTLKKGSPTNPSVKYEITYYKLEVGDRVIFEIDKFNSVCIMNGVDILADMKKYL